MDRLEQARKYFNGELSKQEARAFLQWMNSVSAEEELAAQIDALWDDDTLRYKDYDSERLLKRVHEIKENQFTIGQATAEKKPKGKAVSITWIKWLIAASVSILAVLSVLVSSTPEEQTVAKQSRQIIKENPVGQKSTVHLPDGSVVYLNSESRLTYFSDFTRVRQVELKGEAFFEVARDKKRPFIVKSGRLSTTALGTSFNISTYNDVGEQVTLITGKVKVNDSMTSSSLLLDPLEQVTVGESTNFEKRKVRSADIILWKDGILKFEQVPFPHVVHQLQRWYGVEFSLSGEEKGVLCSGEFKDEYLSNVLEVLSHSVGFTYTIKDKEISIKF